MMKEGGPTGPENVQEEDKDLQVLNEELEAAVKEAKEVKKIIDTQDTGEKPAAFIDYYEVLGVDSSASPEDLVAQIEEGYSEEYSKVKELQEEGTITEQEASRKINLLLKARDTLLKSKPRNKYNDQREKLHLGLEVLNRLHEGKSDEGSKPIPEPEPQVSPPSQLESPPSDNGTPIEKDVTPPGESLALLKARRKIIQDLIDSQKDINEKIAEKDAKIAQEQDQDKINELREEIRSFRKSRLTDRGLKELTEELKGVDDEIQKRQSGPGSPPLSEETIVGGDTVALERNAIVAEREKLKEPNRKNLYETLSEIYADKENRKEKLKEFFRKLSGRRTYGFIKLKDGSVQKCYLQLKTTGQQIIKRGESLVDAGERELEFEVYNMQGELLAGESKKQKISKIQYRDWKKDELLETSNSVMFRNENGGFDQQTAEEILGDIPASQIVKYENAYAQRTGPRPELRKGKKPRGPKPPTGSRSKGEIELETQPEITAETKPEVTPQELEAQQEEERLKGIFESMLSRTMATCKDNVEKYTLDRRAGKLLRLLQEAVIILHDGKEAYDNRKGDLSVDYYKKQTAKIEDILTKCENAVARYELQKAQPPKPSKVEDLVEENDENYEVPGVWEEIVSGWQSFMPTWLGGKEKTVQGEQNLATTKQKESKVKKESEEAPRVTEGSPKVVGKNEEGEDFDPTILGELEKPNPKEISLPADMAMPPLPEPPNVKAAGEESMPPLREFVVNKNSVLADKPTEAKKESTQDKGEGRDLLNTMSEMLGIEEKLPTFDSLIQEVTFRLNDQGIEGEELARYFQESKSRIQDVLGIHNTEDVSQEEVKELLSDLANRMVDKAKPEIK